MMVPRLPGSRMASSASHRPSRATLGRRRLVRPALLEHAEHGLRVVLGGELGEDGLRHLQAFGAGRLRPRQQPARDAGLRAARQEHQHARRPSRLPRRHQHGGTFGDEQAGLAPGLAHLERADQLHPLVLQAGDGAHARARRLRRRHRARSIACRARSAAAARRPPPPRPAPRSRWCPDGRPGIRARGRPSPAPRRGWHSS